MNIINKSDIIETRDKIYEIINSIPKKLLYGPIITLNQYTRFFSYIFNNNSKTDDILEIGCNFGFGLHFLNLLGYNIKGIDIDLDKINFSKDKNINVIYCDITKDISGISDKKYKLIILVGFIHDDFTGLNKKSDYELFFLKVFNNIYKLLDNNGKVIFDFKQEKGIFLKEDLLKILKDYNVIQNEFEKDIYILEKKN